MLHFLLVNLRLSLWPVWIHMENQKLWNHRAAQVTDQLYSREKKIHKIKKKKKRKKTKKEVEKPNDLPTAKKTSLWIHTRTKKNLTMNQENLKPLNLLYRCCLWIKDQQPVHKKTSCQRQSWWRKKWEKRWAQCTESGIWKDSAVPRSLNRDSKNTGQWRLKHTNMQLQLDHSVFLTTANGEQQDYNNLTCMPSVTDNSSSTRVERPNGGDNQTRAMLERCMATCGKAAGARAKMRSRARKESQRPVFRMSCQMAASKSWDLLHIDLKTASLPQDSPKMRIVMLCANCHQKKVIHHILLQDWRNLHVVRMMHLHIGGSFLTKHYALVVWFPHELIDAANEMCSIQSRERARKPSHSRTIQKTPSLNQVSNQKWRLHWGKNKQDPIAGSLSMVFLSHAPSSMSTSSSLPIYPATTHRTSPSWREDLHSGGNPRTTTPTGYEPEELATFSRIEVSSEIDINFLMYRRKSEKKITELLPPKKWRNLEKLGRLACPSPKLSEASYFQSQMHFITKNADLTTVCPESFEKTRCNGHVRER